MELTNQNGNATGTGGPRNDRCILIVDDDRDFLKLLCLCLTMDGFKVTWAESGNEALALMKVKHFAFMLTDYSMLGMDGLKLSDEALKIIPGLSIVILTGNPSTQLYHYASVLGIRAVLVKPLDVKELLKIINGRSR